MEGEGTVRIRPRVNGARRLSRPLGGMTAGRIMHSRNAFHAHCFWSSCELPQRISFFTHIIHHLDVGRASPPIRRSFRASQFVVTANDHVGGRKVDVLLHGCE